MLFLSHEGTFDAARIRLLAHEMFHHWNPLSMGPKEDDSLQWFTDGFTVYYEAAIPLRTGLISYADYLEQLNRRLQQYQLDNVMFDLVSEAQVPKLPELNSDRVFVAFGRYLGPEQTSMLRSMALDGAEVPLPQTLGACARLGQVSRAVVDTGFDESSLNTHHIAGVDPDGPAYRAGIRDGQEVFRVSIYHDDPSKDVLLGVMIDGKRQMIQYSPAKRLIVSQYQVTIDDKAARTRTPF